MYAIICYHTEIIILNLVFDVYQNVHTKKVVSRLNFTFFIRFLDESNISCIFCTYKYKCIVFTHVHTIYDFYVQK